MSLGCETTPDAIRETDVWISQRAQLLHVPVHLLKDLNAAGRNKERAISQTVHTHSVLARFSVLWQVIWKQGLQHSGAGSMDEERVNYAPVVHVRILLLRSFSNH